MRLRSTAVSLLVAILILTLGCSDDPTSPGVQNTLLVPWGYPTIQSALDAAAAGDTILLAAGTYTDRQEYTTFYGRTFEAAGILVPGVVIRGATGDPSDVIIDGQGVGWGLWGYQVGDSTGIADLTVRNTLWGISGYEASPWIENCILEDNGNVQEEGHSAGTGMYFDRSLSTITGCIFRNNQARSGAGATFSTSSDVRLVECQFRENTATSSGGGLSVGNNSQATLIDCMIIGNSSDDVGGGIHCHGDSLVVRGGSITGNTALNEGGGLMVRSIAQAWIEDVNIQDNEAPTGAEGSADHAGAIYLVCCGPGIYEWTGNVIIDNEDCE